jgi:Tol biopolymer transport system component
VDGTGPEERLASGASTQFANGWSHDGRFLAYHQANEAGNTDVWILPMGGDRKPRRFLGTKFDESFASFSPDGRWLAYSSNESGEWEVYATSFPGGEGKWQISTGGGTNPTWTKGGSEIIFYNSRRHGMMSVPITYSPDLHPGKGSELFQLSSDPDYVPDVSPDGEHIAVAQRGKQAQITKLIVVVNWFEELKKQLAAK